AALPNSTHFWHAPLTDPVDAVSAGAGHVARAAVEGIRLDIAASLEAAAELFPGAVGILFADRSLAPGCHTNVGAGAAAAILARFTPYAECPLANAAATFETVFTFQDGLA